MKISKISLNQPASNYTEVSISGYTFCFSYSTCIAVYNPTGPVKCSENIWSTTTGKHLNRIQPDKKKRISYNDFQLYLESLEINVKELIPA